MNTPAYTVARGGSFAHSLSCILVFAIPWGDMVLLPGEVQASRILTVAVALVWAVLLWRTRTIVPLSPPFWLMLAFVLWSGANMIWSLEPERSMRRILSYYQLFLNAWIVWQSSNSLASYRQLLTAYVLGCYVPIAGLGYHLALGVFSGDGRYTAPGFDPNDLAVTIILAIPVAWYLAFERGTYRWLMTLYIPCAIMASLLTASRAAVIVLCIALMFPVTFLPRFNLRTALALLVLLAITVAAGAALKDDVAFRRITTIGEQLNARDLNGRVDIWRRGMDVFFEHPLIGVGGGTLGSAIGARRGRELAAHSTYLGVLVEHGAIGASLFLGALILLFAHIRKTPRGERNMWGIILAGWMVGVSTLSWENREITWLLWGLCASCPPLFVQRQNRYGSSIHVYQAA